jgi:hypothetical protein
MRHLITAMTIIAIVVIAGFLILTQSQPQNTVQIQMSSDPFPLAVGPATLRIALVNSDGSRIENASILVSSQMHHGGMLPINTRANPSADGIYKVPIMWPMMGTWEINVSAQLPDGEEVIQDQFMTYIYGMTTFSTGSRTSYRSEGEYAAALAAKPANELRIVIPQGALALIREGQEDEVIPSQIRLKVSGQNVLVIQNDDIVDHTIGPFYVRSGETLRQKFTSPAEYQGTCSIRYNASVSIIVDE